MHNNVVFIFDIDSTVANTDKRAKLLKDVCVACLTDVVLSESHDRGYQHYCPTCRSHVESKIPQSSWDSFCSPENYDMDEPYPTAIKLINRLRRQGNHVHYITGRNERGGGREATEAWLAKHLDRWETGSRERVVMRPESMRNVPASIYKRNAFLDFKLEMGFPEETTFFFFEDDKYVFPVYSEYGIVIKCPDAWDSILPEGDTSDEPAWRR